MSHNAASKLSTTEAACPEHDGQTSLSWAAQHQVRLISELDRLNREAASPDDEKREELWELFSALGESDRALRVTTLTHEQTRVKRLLERATTPEERLRLLDLFVNLCIRATSKYFDRIIIHTSRVGCLWSEWDHYERRVGVASDGIMHVRHPSLMEQDIDIINTPVGQWINILNSRT